MTTATKTKRIRIELCEVERHLRYYDHTIEIDDGFDEEQIINAITSDPETFREGEIPDGVTVVEIVHPHLEVEGEGVQLIEVHR